MKRAQFDTILLTLYCALIYWLSDQPSLPMPMLFPAQDKLHHFIAYALMGVLAWQAMSHKLSGNRLWLVSVLFCSLYGVSDEFHQSFVPGRLAETGDWIADTMGAVLSTVILYRLRKNDPQEKLSARP